MKHFNDVSPLTIRGVGVFFSLVVAAAGFVLLRQGDLGIFPKRLPGGFTKPIIAVELVQTATDFEAIVGSGSEDRRRLWMIASLWPDNFVTIPTYWLVLIVTAWLVVRSRLRAASSFGIAAAVCATAAALFDFMENRAMRSALVAATGDLTQEMVNNIRQASLCKWGLLSVSIGLLSSLFIARKDWLTVVGALYLVTALVGLLGLYHHPALEWMVIPVALGFIGVALTFTLSPAKVLGEP